MDLKSQLEFYKKELSGTLLSKSEMSKNDSDYVFVEKKLFTHIDHYLQSGNKNILDEFLRDFENNLSRSYGYEVYSLFFAVQKEK